MHDALPKVVLLLGESAVGLSVTGTQGYVPMMFIMRLLARHSESAIVTAITGLCRRAVPRTGQGGTAVPLILNSDTRTFLGIPSSVSGSAARLPPPERQFLRRIRLPLVSGRAHRETDFGTSETKGPNPLPDGLRCPRRPRTSHCTR